MKEEGGSSEGGGWVEWRRRVGRVKEEGGSSEGEVKCICTFL